MPKYNVYLVAVASTVVTVEAEDKDAAHEAAFTQRLPYSGYGSGFDLGDWELPSDLFPNSSMFEDDIVEVDE